MTTSISSEEQNFVDGTDGHCCFLQTTGNLILITLTEKKFKSINKHQRYGGKCKKYKNSQKPAKRQSDRHC